MSHLNNETPTSNPLQYSCLENPHGQRCLAGYSPWGRKESDTTEWQSTARLSFLIWYISLLWLDNKLPQNLAAQKNKHWEINFSHDSLRSSANLLPSDTGESYWEKKTLFKTSYGNWRLPWWLRWYRIILQCRRPRFNPWVEKFLWTRAWQPTPVFLPGESPWTEVPGGLQSMGWQRVGHDWETKHTHGIWTETISSPLPSQLRKVKSLLHIDTAKTTRLYFLQVPSQRIFLPRRSKISPFLILRSLTHR